MTTKITLQSRSASLTEQRDAELLRTYKLLLASCWRIDQRQVLRQLVEQPCSRFWVNWERAVLVVRPMLQGRPVVIERQTPSKREMYECIADRTRALLLAEPSLSIPEAVCKVVHSPAPRFFLAPQSAKVILSVYRKRLRNERRRTTHTE